MDTLKKYLADNDVEYLEKVFATSESIGGLLPSPFVSHANHSLPLSPAAPLGWVHNTWHCPVALCRKNGFTCRDRAT